MEILPAKQGADAMLTKSLVVVEKNIIGLRKLFITLRVRVMFRIVRARRTQIGMVEILVSIVLVEPVTFEVKCQSVVESEAEVL